MVTNTRQLGGIYTLHRYIWGKSKDSARKSLLYGISVCLMEDSDPRSVVQGSRTQPAGLDGMTLSETLGSAVNQ